MRSWFQTQSLVIIKIKKEREKKNEKGKKGKSITWLKGKGSKTVLQRFFAKLNGSMKLLRSVHPRIIFWKSLSNIGSKMWYRFDVSWKIVVFNVQSGLKLQYDFSIEDGEWKWTECVKTTVNEIFNLFCIAIAISLFERLELLELTATSTAVLFCGVSL